MDETGWWPLVWRARSRRCAGSSACLGMTKASGWAASQPHSGKAHALCGKRIISGSHGGERGTAPLSARGYQHAVYRRNQFLPPDRLGHRQVDAKRRGQAQGRVGWKYQTPARDGDDGHRCISLTGQPDQLPTIDEAHGDVGEQQVVVQRQNVVFGVQATRPRRAVCPPDSRILQNTSRSSRSSSTTKTTAMCPLLFLQSRQTHCPVGLFPDGRAR
jgi:hypothetical protein